MGVTGLWKLIEPCGSPVPLEMLECKVLAVDISIWLHQVVKGFHDSKGSALPNAHLLGLFHRLCKLLYYRVKPIFVFDGCVPQLKRETIARRQMQRSKLNGEADRIQGLLLQSLAKEKVVQQALCANTAQLLLKSPIKCAISSTNRDEATDEIFQLPELQKESVGLGSDCTLDNSRDYSESRWVDTTTTSSEDESSFEESDARRNYYANLQAIDVHSKHFKDLPAAVRHDILTDIKETRKQSSWGQLHELPEKGLDFSSFQMKRLLRRRAVQESIEEAEKEMESSSLTYLELKKLFEEQDPAVGLSSIDKGSKQICSDESARFLHVRDLKRKLTSSDKNSARSEEQEMLQLDEKPSSSEKTFVTTKRFPEVKNEISEEEYDSDFQLAIALSLKHPATSDAEYYDYDSDENVKLNKNQKEQLKNAAVGPARAYLVEYAGINDKELFEITDEKSINVGDDDRTVIKKIGKANSIDNNSKKIVPQHSELTNVNDDVKTISAPETDLHLKKALDENEKGRDLFTSKNFEIVIDPTRITKTPEDELFADIFFAETNDSKEEKYIKDSSTVLINSISQGTDVPIGRPVTSNIMAALDQLKKQADEVNKITLDDVRIDSSITYISDEDVEEMLDVKIDQITPTASTSPKPHTRTSEIIEIPDDNVIESELNLNLQLKTPTKNKTISEYVQTDYAIKRTPEKKEDQNPKSSRKRHITRDSESLSPVEKASQVSKLLLPNSKEIERGPLGMASVNHMAGTEDTSSQAANLLKNNTTEELEELAVEIAKERHNLESERNRQDRMGTSISQRMNSDCQELLRLFGIPYIVAPMEAEAQCAFLDAMNLTNGTITEDSDIWLFGGRTVYKNFFAQNKHALEFQAKKIENTFNCDRTKLIQMACLVGSDYTAGVHGIGTVTALEILASFCARENLSQTETPIKSALCALNKFRDWWIANKLRTTPPTNATRLALWKKLKNIELHEGFPSTAVIEAYLKPKVDESKEAFTWGYPNIEAIRAFTRKNFGWTTSKTDDILNPVIKKSSQKTVQTTIENYFTIRRGPSIRNLKVSRRVQKAIEKMSDTVEPEEESKRPRRVVKTKRETRCRKQVIGVPEKKKNNMCEDVSPEADSNCNKSEVPTKKTYSNAKEIIPQREKDLQQMRRNREKAAMLMRKARDQQ